MHDVVASRRAHPAMIPGPGQQRSRKPRQGERAAEAGQRVGAGCPAAEVAPRSAAGQEGDADVVPLLLALHQPVQQATGVGADAAGEGPT